MWRGPHVRCKPLTHTAHNPGYPTDQGSRPAPCASFPGPGLCGRELQSPHRFGSITKPETEGLEPVKPATRQQQAINWQLTDPAATMDRALPHPPSRRLHSRPTTGGAGGPNGILQQEGTRAEQAGNRCGTGSEQTANKPPTTTPRTSPRRPAPPPPILRISRFRRVSRFRSSFGPPYPSPAPGG
jgi:hypothetical protein